MNTDNTAKQINDLTDQIARLEQQRACLIDQQTSDGIARITRWLACCTFYIDQLDPRRVYVAAALDAETEAFETAVCEFCGSHDGTKPISSTLSIYAGDGGDVNIHLTDGKTSLMGELAKMGIRRAQFNISAFDNDVRTREKLLADAIVERDSMTAFIAAYPDNVLSLSQS